MHRYCQTFCHPARRSFSLPYTVVLASGFVFALAGCSRETVQSAARDTAKNAVVVQREVKRAERKARPQVDALKIGGRVTAALLANENLPASIRVDASETGVKLRGKVKTAAQKSLAERIARDTLGPDKTVQNDLVVEQK